MKSSTRKYVRLLDAETRLQREIDKIPLGGQRWRTNRDKVERLESKLADFGKKREAMQSEITQGEFNEHLAYRMCCSWEDFNGDQDNNAYTSIEQVRNDINEGNTTIYYKSLNYFVDIDKDGDLIIKANNSPMRELLTDRHNPKDFFNTKQKQ